MMIHFDFKRIKDAYLACFPVLNALKDSNTPAIAMRTFSTTFYQTLEADNYIRQFAVGFSNELSAEVDEDGSFKDKMEDRKKALATLSAEDSKDFNEMIRSVLNEALSLQERRKACFDFVRTVFNPTWPATLRQMEQREALRKKYLQIEDEQGIVLTQADETLKDILKSSHSLAMKGFIQMGLKICDMVNPRMAARFLRIDYPLMDECSLSMSDFLAIVQGLEESPYFKAKHASLESATAACIQEEKASARKDFLQRCGKNLSKAQQDYLGLIDKHNQEQAVDFRLVVASNVTAPLCDFFVKFHQQCTTLEEKREAFINLVLCIYSSAKFVEDLTKMQSVIEKPAQKAIVHGLDIAKSQVKKAEAKKSPDEEQSKKAGVALH